jgi:hypothetical protein
VLELERGGAELSLPPLQTTSDLSEREAEKSEMEADQLDRAVESALEEGRLKGVLEGMAAMLRRAGVSSVESFRKQMGCEPSAAEVAAITGTLLPVAAAEPLPASPAAAT